MPGWGHPLDPGHSLRHRLLLGGQDPGLRLRGAGHGRGARTHADLPEGGVPAPALRLPAALPRGHHHGGGPGYCRQ